MALLDLDGLVLHHTDRPADPAAPPGPDLVLLHGYGVTGAIWDPVLPFIPDGHRVVTFDARNHGGSGTTRTASIADNVADIIGVIRELRLDRPVLIGSSIGALFATEVARSCPEMIGGAVLVGGLAHAAVIKVPLHYVHGTLDSIPLPVVQEAAALTPHATLRLIEGAAHMPHVELPGRFADVLVEVFTENTATAAVSS